MENMVIMIINSEKLIKNMKEFRHSNEKEQMNKIDKIGEMNKYIQNQ